MELLDSVGEAAKLFAGAVTLANGGTYLFTIAYPERTPAAAVVCALLCGICATLLLALATALPMTVQTVAQVVIVGMLAGGGASGLKALADKSQDEQIKSKERRTRRVKVGPIV